MTISGSGTGTPGGIPEYPLVGDQTAAANVLRQGMGIVKNLDTIIFTDVDKKALWKYDTSSSKPSLHPLEHMRIDTSAAKIDDSWKEFFQELINDLPEEVRTAYELNLQLPLQDRNASLVALGRLLEGTAKILAWLQISSEALDPNNPEAGPGSNLDERRSLNMALVHTAMNGIAAEGLNTFQSIAGELLRLGRNDPHFDELTNLLNQTAGTYGALLNLNKPTEQP